MIIDLYTCQKYFIDHIVIDYCAYENGSIITDLYLNSERNAASTYECILRRLVVPLKFDEKVL